MLLVLFKCMAMFAFLVATLVATMALVGPLSGLHTLHTQLL